MTPSRLLAAVTAVAALTVVLAPAAAAAPEPRPAASDRLATLPPPPGWVVPDTLRRAAPIGFNIGSAVAGGGHHLTQPYPDPFTSDRQYRRLLGAEFDSVSAENQMKWDYLRPSREEYDFAVGDQIIEFARYHRQDVRGHTLLWHSQNPEWLEQGDFTPEELREILREHIFTVAGRYAGRIQQWDVANEIFNEDGSLRTENIWIRELGVGIVADAFRWTHEADPKAKLYVNDFNVEGINPKSDAYYALIQELLAQDVPVDGFSTQGHLSIRFGFPGDLQQNLQRFADLGLETAITELDVRMDLPDGAVPTAEQEAQQAEYYQRMLAGCLAVRGCDSVTIWGFTDTYSWVPVTFPGEGAATIMDGEFVRKPAYDALRRTLLDAPRIRR